MSTPRLAAVHVGGPPEAWTALGFTVDRHDAIALANGSLVTGSPGGLSVDPAGAQLALPGDIEGVPLAFGTPGPAAIHRNGARQLDHLVLITDSLERTSAAVAERLGLAQRRAREVGEGDRQVRQAFHRFAPAEDGTRGCIVEIVESARTKGPTALFGVVVIVDDLATVCATLGPDLIGSPKPAVQPGRSIATVRRSAGLGAPVALMTPDL